MNASELQARLRELDLTPSRKLGQSFLTDGDLSRWIAAQLRAGPEDIVVEAGPGLGALTEHLAEPPRRLVLLERDGRLASFLRERYGPRGAETVHGDAAAHDPRPYFAEGGIKFIGNLPYSAGGEILRTFLDAPSPVRCAVVMVQKEVADRLCARPRSKAYGVLSLLFQERWRITPLKTVGPAPFHPRPEVESTVLRFDPLPPGELPLHSGEVFRSSVKRGFSARRKQLRKNLGLPPERWEGICADLGLPATARAEELSVEQWAELSNRLEPHPCASLPPSEGELLEAVDEDDRVVEALPRSEIHERGLRHRAVHVLLRNPAGEIYLQKRSHLKDSHPGKWDSSASGHVDPGESYGDCALREMWEECWTRPRGELRRVARLDASPETDQEFIEIFTAEPRDRIRVHGREVECGRHFTPEQIERWIERRPGDFATGFRSCFRAWREGEG